MSFTFGILSSINPIIATLAFICTIIFLIFFEFLTGALEYLLEGNHVYNEMLQKIYKELMVMGFVSFVLAMYKSKHDLTHLNDLFRVTEFVEYILFFLALFYVAHCLYIMFISVVTSRYYEKVHAQPVINIIERFTKLEKSFSSTILSIISYFPISRSIHEAEFKIIYALFRDTYWLPLDFDYGGYLSGCLANYTHKLINVSVHSWIILIFLSLLNLARLKLFGNSAFNCKGFQYTDDLLRHHDDSNHTTDDHGDADDDHHRFLSSAPGEVEREVTQRCDRQHLYLFFICGGLLCLYVILLYVMAQVYMKRLLGRAGVLDISDYSEFLMFEERAVLNVEKKRIEIGNTHHGHGEGNGSTPSTSRRHRRMTIRTFKSNIQNLRAASGHEHQNEEFEIYRKISRALSLHFRPSESLTEAWDWFTSSVSSVYHSVFTPKVHDSGGGNIAKLIYRDSTAHTNGGRPADEDNDVETGSGREETPKPVEPKQPPGRRKRRVSTMLLLSGGPLANHAALGVPEIKTQDSMSSVERFKLHKFQQTTDADEKIEFFKNVRKKTTFTPTREQMKLTEDMSEIYLFNSPELFCRAIDAAIMLNALYLSLWATNFITVVDSNFSNQVGVLQLMLLIPIIFVLPCIGEIVKASSLLSAIAELNLNVIGSVLEATDDQSNLVLELREKINIRLVGVVADQKEVLAALFDEIDTDGSGAINRPEFRNMLQALHLHYSDQKFQRLFKAVDRNKDGSISIDELYTILFPEKAEEEAIQKRSERVEKHLEERRQSQAIQNVKTKTGALAMLRGLSRGAEVDPIEEDTEAKTVEDDLHLPLPGQQSQNSFSVGGKIVRLSKAATTGRISVPLQDFKIPVKQFERPKIVSEEKTPTPLPLKQPEKFTVLSEVSSPRSSRLVEPNSVNPYQAVGDGYEAQSETEVKPEPSPQNDSSTGVFFQTRNRSKSEEAPPKHQTSGPLRSSLIAMEPLTSIPSDSDVVSGFHENHSPGEQTLPIQGGSKYWNVSDMEEEGEEGKGEDE